jgi:hypothetical protein
VLLFAGFKMLAGEWLHIPPLASVAIISACVAAAASFSLRSTDSEQSKAA